MLDVIFLAGQAASALLLLYGGYLAGFSWIATRFESAPHAQTTRARQLNA
jgi:hypothetical protein